jgi:O-antigen/teichoic acid export membrane protein
LGAESATAVANDEPAQQQEIAPRERGGSELKKLGKHTMIYGAGVIISKLASFIMLPIYTHFLTPADYGVLELLSTTIDVIGTIAGIGIANSVAKFYAEFDDPEDQKKVVSTAAIATLVMALVASLSGWGFSGPLSRMVLGADGRPLYFQVFVLIDLLTTAEAIPLLMLRTLNRSTVFVTLSVAKLLAMLSLNIFFVVHLRLGVIGVLYSNLIASTVSGLTLSGLLFHHAGFRFDWGKFRTMAVYSFPVMLVYIGNAVLVFSDRYFIGHYFGNGEVGIYSLAYKFAFMLSAFAFTPFQMVWGPQRFQIARKPNAGEVFSRVFVYLNLVLGGVAMVIAVLVRDVISVMADPAFITAHRIVAVLLAAQILYNWSMFANFGLLAKDKTKHFLYASMIAVGATLVFNFLLIPRFGIYGATAATFLAYGVRFLSVNVFSQRQYHVHYQWSVIARMYLVFGGAVAVRAVLPHAALPASLATSAILILAAISLVYRFVLTPDEKAAVRAFASRSRAALQPRVSRAA